MKGILIISLILFTSLATARLQIQVGQQPKLKQGQGYELSCTGAQGHVNYEAMALPQGIVLNGHTLQITDASVVKSGAHPVQIKATDANGQSDSRIIVIIIQNNSNSQNNRSQASSQTMNTAQSSSSSSVVIERAVVDDGLQDLLNTIDIPADLPATDFSQGYPTANLPSGSTSQIPNYQLRTIATSQATPSAANRNEITAEDARAQAIFQRQFNAAKALGNLISIIKQATANQNVAQEEVLTRTEKLEVATNHKQQADLAIQDADNNYKRAQAAVSNINQQVQDLQQKIAQYENDLKQRKMEKASVETGLRRANDNLALANQQLQDAQKRLADTSAELADKQVECSGLQQELNKAVSSFNERPAQKRRYEESLQIAKKKVAADQDLIVTLRRRLAEAEQELQNSQAEVSAIETKLDNFNAETITLEGRIRDLSERFERCQKEYKGIEAAVNNIRLNVIPPIEDRIFQINNQIEELNNKLDELNADIASLPIKISEAQQKLKGLQERLQYLRGQTLILQRLLREAFLQGNAANEAVAIAQQNLEAATARLEKETKIIQEATINLEKARIEKEQADLFVESYLKQGADILPFPAAPESNGVIENEGTYQITGWGSFVAEAFGQSVKPVFTGDLKTLFPWRFENQSNLREAECAESGLSALSGYVLSVDGNNVNLIDSNTDQIYQVQISDCTMNLANEQNYSIQSGDIMIAKGALNDSVLHASQTACIRR